jgi:hypothetical protein
MRHAAEIAAGAAPRSFIAFVGIKLALLLDVQSV